MSTHPTGAQVSPARDSICKLVCIIVRSTRRCVPPFPFPPPQLLPFLFSLPLFEDRGGAIALPLSCNSPPVVHELRPYPSISYSLEATPKIEKRDLLALGTVPSPTMWTNVDPLNHPLPNVERSQCLSSSLSSSSLEFSLSLFYYSPFYFHLPELLSWLWNLPFFHRRLL